jgi:hypothetical protein
MESLKEYNATQTNTGSCYSNLNHYGVNCALEGYIVPPTPATVQPALFNVMRPHQVPQIVLKQSEYNIPYKSVWSFGSKESYPVGQFRPGFNDITR